MLLCALHEATGREDVMKGHFGELWREPSEAYARERERGTAPGEAI